MHLKLTAFLVTLVGLMAAILCARAYLRATVRQHLPGHPLNGTAYRLILLGRPYRIIAATALTMLASITLLGFGLGAALGMI